MGTVRIPRVSPSAFGKLATTVAVCYGLLVVTGGAVRLTGSGLGCRDWPTCSKSDLIASASFHPLVEFSNRCVTVVVSVVSIAVFLAALQRAPRRRDLTLLSGLILGGLLAQVVLGGLVVLFKLNPWLVALHFVLTLVMLLIAIVLRQQNLHSGARGAPRLPNGLLWLLRLQLATLAILVLAGTVVTGSGPHAGGPGAKRIDISFLKMAELHADVALFLIGMSLASLFALHQAHAPGDIQRRARWFLELLAVQGTLGYTQFFLHDSAWVIEFHLLGATLLWSVLTIQYFACFTHRAEVLRAKDATAEELAPAGAGVVS